MKEQEIKETLSDIKDLMERSQKVMFVDGTSGIVVALWALLGAIAVTYVIDGTDYGNNNNSAHIQPI